MNVHSTHVLSSLDIKIHAATRESDENMDVQDELNIFDILTLHDDLTIILSRSVR